MVGGGNLSLSKTNPTVKFGSSGARISRKPTRSVSPGRATEPSVSFTMARSGCAPLPTPPTRRWPGRRRSFQSGPRTNTDSAPTRRGNLSPQIGRTLQFLFETTARCGGGGGGGGNRLLGNSCGSTGDGEDKSNSVDRKS